MFSLIRKLFTGIIYEKDSCSIPLCNMYVKYFLCLKHIQTSPLDKYVEMIVQHKTLIQKYICCKMSHCHITTCVDPKGLKIERFKPPLKKISGLDLDMNNIQSVLQYKYFCVYWHVPVLTGVVWCPTDIYVNFYAILLYITEMRVSVHLLSDI